MNPFPTIFFGARPVTYAASGLRPIHG